MSDHPFLNDRSSAEQYFLDEAPDIAAFEPRLYEREQVADFRVGDVLFYRHDVWHRGRPCGRHHAACPESYLPL